MKTNIFTVILLGCTMMVAGLSSCTKETAPDAKLSVRLDKVEYLAGEEVTFSLSGTPDNIVFYSGENGYNYSLKDRLWADNDFIVDFKSYSQYAVHPNLSFLVSNDFSGTYDKEGVESATWIDITSEFIMSSGLDQTTSGEVNLKSYAGESSDAIFYFAFRYKKVDVTQKNRWIIRAINANLISPEGVKTTAGVMSTMDWKVVELINVTPATWTVTAQQLLSVATANRDGWVISKGFKVKSAVPDTGVALKNISTTLDQHKHIYKEAGTYRAVFDNSSVWYNGIERSLTEVIVEVK